MSATYQFGQPLGNYPSVQNPRIQYQDEEEEYDAYAHQQADAVAAAAATSAAQYRASQQLPRAGKIVGYDNAVDAAYAAPSTLSSVPKGGVNLIKAQTDPWGEGGTGLGLKIMCGVLGLIIVILLVIMIVKMINQNSGSGSSGSSSGRSTGLSSSESQDQLPMSLQGGMMFADESFMSTAEL